MFAWLPQDVSQEVSQERVAEIKRNIWGREDLAPSYDVKAGRDPPFLSSHDGQALDQGMQLLHKGYKVDRRCITQNLRKQLGKTCLKPYEMNDNTSKRKTHLTEKGFTCEPIASQHTGLTKAVQNKVNADHDRFLSYLHIFTDLPS